MAKKYDEDFAIYRSRFDPFLKCVESLAPPQKLSRTVIWAGANKIVEYITSKTLSSKIVKEISEKSASEIHMVTYPDEAAFEYINFVLGLESKADWIPDHFIKLPEEVSEKVAKMLAFYQACDSQSSQIITPG